MDSIIQHSLADYLTALGDDELILGHRDSEWCGHAPILEEDIAFANLALDEIGHASLWYALLAELEGQDPYTYPDWLVFHRPAQAFRNVQMVALPHGDWAFSMLRQHLFDAAEAVRLEGLSASRYTPVAEAAAKIRLEERYHLRHTGAWVRRLGLGTEESHWRLQQALDELWPLAYQLFVPLPGEESLVEAGYVPASASLQAAWEAHLRPLLADCELQVPSGGGLSAGREVHTPHQKVLVAEMQSVARLEPEARW